MNSPDSSLSVVIPAFNSATVLPRAIKSAFEAGAMEVFVVDDGSTDETSYVAERLGCRLIRQGNTGAAVARQVGIARTGGRFIVLLDADDALHPEGTRALLGHISQKPSLAVVAGRVRIRESGSVLVSPFRSLNTAGLLHLGYSPWPPGAAVWRGDWLRGLPDLAPTPLNPVESEDYEMLVRMSLLGPIELHPKTSLIYTQVGGKSARNADVVVDCKERIRAYYSAYLGVPATVWGPRRRKGAAHLRRARGSTSTAQSLKYLALAAVADPMLVVRGMRRRWASTLFRWRSASNCPIDVVSVESRGVG